MEILLVEDTPADAEIARIAITRSGFAGPITHVADGEHAIEWLDALEPARGSEAAPLPRLMLLDLKMPRLDGHEVLRVVKGSPALRRMPVVVFTSSREQRDVARAFEFGANSYVVKPVEFAEYCAAVKTLVEFWTRVSVEPTYIGVD
jgi:CheY-like chemotaxis protein